MNYKTLPYFMKIADTGSLTEAGKALGVSVSALSRYVAELEKYFGMPLFQRQKQEMLLTEAGKLYYQGCRRLQELQNKTRYEMAKLTAAGRERLRMGMTPSGVALLIPLYQELMQAFPELDLEIVEGYAFELLEGIRNGSIDMLFGYYHPDYLDGVEYALFFRGEIYLLVPRYHPVSASGGGSWRICRLSGRRSCGSWRACPSPTLRMRPSWERKFPGRWESRTSTQFPSFAPATPRW